MFLCLLCNSSSDENLDASLPTLVSVAYPLALVFKGVLFGTKKGLGSLSEVDFDIGEGLVHVGGTPAAICCMRGSSAAACCCDINIPGVDELILIQKTSAS